jgi:hypothetical protein
MNERDEILKKNRDSTIPGGIPKTSAGFLITFIARNISALSGFIHKWGRP